MAHFNWLHLSDLHVGMTDKGRLWPAAERILLADLDRVVERVGQFDIVFFTGDAAQRGLPEEFKRFDDILATIWDKVGGPETVFLAIPGNHDLERPSSGNNPVARGLLNSEEAREGLWDGDRDAVQFVRDRFAAFADWWERTPHRPRERYSPGLLPGDFCYVHRRGETEIGVVGINST